jgi:hypothetical protein
MRSITLQSTCCSFIVYQNCLKTCKQLLTVDYNVNLTIPNLVFCISRIIGRHPHTLHQNYTNLGKMQKYLIIVLTLEQKIC